MFSLQAHKKARHILRPQLESLCTRERTGNVSSDAQNLLVAGLCVLESAQTYGSVLMAQARTGKDCPTIQARDELAAVRLGAIRAETDAATFLLTRSTGKHPDRKRFNRARYEARKAAKAAPVTEAKTPKKKTLKKSAAAAAASPASAASPSTRKRARAE